MTKHFLTGIALVGILVLKGCTAKTDPPSDPPSEKPGPVVQEPPKPKEATPATADMRKVTIVVDGMVDRLNLV